MPVTIAAGGRPQPTPVSERVALLDALRGFALFGILMMNLADFSGYFQLSDADKATLATAATDDGALIIVATLFHGKFYTIFSLLFGIGIALQIERAAPPDRLLRRFFWLFVFGLLHMFIIWPGDILAPYAVAGVLLLALARLPDRTVLVAGLLLLVAPVLMHGLYVGLGLDPRAAVLSVVDAQISAGGGWRDAIVGNLMNPLRRLANLLGENRMFKILGMFAIGLWVGRRGIFRDPAAFRPLLVGLFVAGLLIGVPASGYFEILSMDEYFPASMLGLQQSVAYALGVAPLGIAWACGFALLWQRPVWRQRLAVFAPAGRMALSNYLIQSVVGAIVFVLTLTRIIDPLGPTLWPFVTAAILAVQVVWSKRWLARHRYGPLEGVWRRLTYR